MVERLMKGNASQGAMSDEADSTVEEESGGTGVENRGPRRSRMSGPELTALTAPWKVCALRSCPSPLLANLRKGDMQGSSTVFRA